MQGHCVFGSRIEGMARRMGGIEMEGSCARKAWEGGRYEREENVRESKVRKVDVSRWRKSKWRAHLGNTVAINDHHGSHISSGI